MHEAALTRQARLNLHAAGYRFPDPRDSDLQIKGLTLRWRQLLTKKVIGLRKQRAQEARAMNQPSNSDATDPYNTADSARWKRPDFGDPQHRYLGNVHGVVYRVQKDGTRAPLDPRLDLVRHSSAGFGWGYGGSGPAQLAIAMLADATGDDETARDHYYDFKWQVISKLAYARPFELTSLAVRTWLATRIRTIAHRGTHGR